MAMRTANSCRRSETFDIINPATSTKEWVGIGRQLSLRLPERDSRLEAGDGTAPEARVRRIDLPGGQDTQKLKGHIKRGVRPRPQAAKGRRSDTDDRENGIRQLD